MEWNGKTRNNAELEFVIQTPLHTTVVVDTESKCENAIQQIIADSSEIKAVGFDCEWIGDRILTKYGKVLIVSICTSKGYCALFRMNKFRPIPKSLQDLLEDETLTKVSFAINICVSHLWEDYRIQVKVFRDLREKLCQDKQELEEKLGPRLQHIAQHFYNVTVHRDLTDFDSTKFVALKLSPDAIEFANKNVHAFIEAYKHMFC